MTEEQFQKKFPKILREDRETRCHYDEDYNVYVLQLYEAGKMITEIKFNGVSTMQETIRHWLQERKRREIC